MKQRSCFLNLIIKSLFAIFLMASTQIRAEDGISWAQEDPMVPNPWVVPEDEREVQPTITFSYRVEDAGDLINAFFWPVNVRNGEMIQGAIVESFHEDGVHERENFVVRWPWAFNIPGGEGRIEGVRAVVAVVNRGVHPDDVMNLDRVRARNIFHFDIVYGNQPPVLAEIGNRETNEGEVLAIDLSAEDPDGDNLTYSSREDLPDGAELDAENGEFRWTPRHNQANNYEVTFVVTDDGEGNLTDEETITITVCNVNRPPVLSEIGDQEVNEGEELMFTLEAADPDDDNLNFSAENLPDGASLEGADFSWTPGFDQSGEYEDVTFSVTDGELSDEETITITVLNVNRSPVLSEIGDQEVNEGQELAFTLEASDPDDDGLEFSAENLPDGA
ncbi:MAG: Ig-like domain-containing protein, partial [Candidatus Hatepunaea meridiana]|nr:Ig-like domain-containing protein [Candidatus Hatepunaea meridiana]